MCKVWTSTKMSVVSKRNASRPIMPDSLECQTRLKYFKTKRRNQLATIQLRDTLKEINKEATEMLDKAYNKISNLAQLRKERVRTTGHFSDSIPTDLSDDSTLLNSLRVRKRPWLPFCGQTIDTWAKKGGKKFSMCRIGFQIEANIEELKARAERSKTFVPEIPPNTEPSISAAAAGQAQSSPQLHVATETPSIVRAGKQHDDRNQGEKSIKKVLTFTGISEQPQDTESLNNARAAGNRTRYLSGVVDTQVRKPSVSAHDFQGRSLVPTPPLTAPPSNRLVNPYKRGKKLLVKKDDQLPPIEDSLFYMSIFPPMSADQLQGYIEKRKQTLPEQSHVRQRSLGRNEGTTKEDEKKSAPWSLVAGLAKWRKKAERAAKTRYKRAFIKTPPPYIPRRSTSGSSIATPYNKEKAMCNFEKLKEARAKGQRTRSLYIPPEERYKKENIFMMKRFLMLQRHVDVESYRHLVENEMRSVRNSSVMSKYARNKALETLKDTNSATKKTETKQMYETTIQQRVEEFVKNMIAVVKATDTGTSTAKNRAMSQAKSKHKIDNKYSW